MMDRRNFLKVLGAAVVAPTVLLKGKPKMASGPTEATYPWALESNFDVLHDTLEKFIAKEPPLWYGHV